MGAGLDPGAKKKPARIIKRELSTEERAHTRARTHTHKDTRTESERSRGALIQSGARRTKSP
ncbi:hypothetical protein INR49_025632 [Caranx melampygus]|nr:hypothetical protein INR49_025632 [Caranx melampygus]